MFNLEFEIKKRLQKDKILLNKAIISDLGFSFTNYVPHVNCFINQTSKNRYKPVFFIFPPNHIE